MISCVQFKRHELALNDFKYVNHLNRLTRRMIAKQPFSELFYMTHTCTILTKSRPGLRPVIQHTSYPKSYFRVFL